MPYEPKVGSFSLFKVDKEGNEKRPDYRGDGLDLEGRQIEVACWIKQGKTVKYMSCTMKVKQDPKGEATLDSGIKRNTNVDEDIPSTIWLAKSGKTWGHLE